MKEIFNNKKNKVIFILIGIVLVVVLAIIIGVSFDRNKTRKSLMEDSYWWTKSTKYEKTGEWINREYAIDGVERAFKYMISLNDKSHVDYEFYRKYLTEEEINSILLRCYEKLSDEYNLPSEEVDVLLKMFLEDKQTGYNSFDNYMKYLGERAYFYQEEDSSCSIRILTSTYDDYVNVKEQYKNEGINYIKYSIVLKDKDYKIIDVIKKEETTYYKNEKSNVEYKIDQNGVDKVEVYINHCSD